MYKDILKKLKLPQNTAQKVILAALLIATMAITITIAVIADEKKAVTPEKENALIANSRLCEAHEETRPVIIVPEAIEQTVADETVEETTVVTYPQWTPETEDVEALAKVLYGECRGVKSTMEQAAVAWCVLNRVDNKHYPNTVLEVLSQPHQFHGYNEDHPVLSSLAELAEDVLIKWHSEQEGEEECGRVLPKSYIYFVGDGARNYFTEEFHSKNYWDFSLPNPYES